MEQIKRIARMERYLDAATAAIHNLNKALDEYTAAQETLHTLTGYYDGGTWLEDYEADENGALPADLKRGVLSQDALYDLFAENRALLLRMAEIAGSR